MQKTIDLPPALAAIAAGRDFLTTRELAKALNKQGQTIRKLHCLRGEAYGIRPTKIGAQLNWPVASVAAVLNGEAPTATAAAAAVSTAKTKKTKQAGGAR